MMAAAETPKTVSPATPHARPPLLRTFAIHADAKRTTVHVDGEPMRGVVSYSLAQSAAPGDGPSYPVLCLRIARAAGEASGIASVVDGDAEDLLDMLAASLAEGSALCALNGETIAARSHEHSPEDLLAMLADHKRRRGLVPPKRRAGD